MGHRLTKIYTRTGDDGRHGLDEDRASCATSSSTAKSVVFAVDRRALRARGGASLRRRRAAPSH